MNGPVSNPIHKTQLNVDSTSSMWQYSVSHQVKIYTTNGCLPVFFLYVGKYNANAQFDAEMATWFLIEPDN